MELIDDIVDTTVSEYKDCTQGTRFEIFFLIG